MIAAWSFGSAQTGTVRSGGDLDIAVLFADLPSLAARTSLLGDLQRALGLDQVDLMILHDASPIARMEALAGRLLFSRDEAERAAFASLAAREYESEMAFLAWGLSMRDQTREEPAI